MSRIGSDPRSRADGSSPLALTSPPTVRLSPHPLAPTTQPQPTSLAGNLPLLPTINEDAAERESIVRWIKSRSPVAMMLHDP